MSRPPWIFFTVGVVAAFAVTGIGAVGVVETGAFDVASSTQHSVAVAWATYTTMSNLVKLRALHATQTIAFSKDQIEAGFNEYESHCIVCHGGPSVDRQPWVQGMTPTPPFLLDASRQSTPAQLYWIVANGVKMTGMPAWRETLTKDQIWNLVAFLEDMPNRASRQFAVENRIYNSYGQNAPVANAQTTNDNNRNAVDYSH